MLPRLYLLLLICVAGGNLQGQICQGSLGDPIINITFGAGANPGPPLSAATTNYQFSSTDCPNDGFYAVRNNTNNCFDNTWFTVTDHTGNANGYFMLVNASYQPGEFYRDTVRGLCSGSTYEFAAWLTNVKRPVICWGASQIIDPNITFRIEKTDGTIIQTYNTGNIGATDPPQWKQYGFFFTTPASISEVVLRMVNNAPGGCGNDIGLDDITFRACGPQTTVNIVESGSLTDSICEGSATQRTFNANVSAGYNNPVYQWQRSTDSINWTDIPGATTTQYTSNFPSNATTGKYYFRIAVAEAGNMGVSKCMIASKPITIYITSRPSFSISSNSPVCEGGKIQLTASRAGVNWAGPNGYTFTGDNASVENAQQINAGKYFAYYSTSSCNTSDSTVVTVNQKPVLQLSRDTATVCEGQPVEITASGATNYIWLPGEGLSSTNSATTIASPVKTTTYTVVGTNGNACVDSATVKITVNQKPVANAGTDFSMILGTSAVLQGSVIGEGVTYFWTPDYQITGKESLNPTISPEKDTVYVLNVVSETGCGTAQDAVRIRIFKEIKVPTAFSPNNDGINDKWIIPGINSYPGAEVSIFNRYGNELFRSSNFNSWDGSSKGKPLPTGTYYYLINLKNGFSMLSGWVYLAK